jgi:predicted ATP-dependent endonuclease of OLD family
MVTRPITKAEARRLSQPLGKPHLVGFEIENLRGFRQATLDLTPDLMLLVGPNNSGKTSIFRLLDWLLNAASEPTLRGDLSLTDEEQQLLIPARNTRGGARRLVLRVKIRDGRRSARFFAKDGIARLRFRVRSDRIYANVRPPRRSETLDAEDDALELLRELRDATYFRHVPASRDVASERFGKTLTTALEARLSERAVHQARAGAPSEYRQLKQALASLREVAETLAAPLWDDVRAELMPSLARDASFRLTVDAPDLVKWMARRMELKLVTGDHDPDAVFPIEVGSGLQSLLDLAMFRAEAIPKGVDPILAVEEPEAFLHPTAQRTLARRLIADDSLKLLISTHSSTFVEEASYDAVALVRNHVVFQPPRDPEPRRAEINSALLSGQGAEMVFSRGVLLVEGEGDKLFFETLRRRLASHDPTGSLDELSIVWVGSNTIFAPWIRLLEGYANDGLRALEWLAVADGADSASLISHAFRAAHVRFPDGIEQALQTVAQAAGANNQDGLVFQTRRFNQAARTNDFRATLLPIDLEYAALADASRATVLELNRRLGLDAQDKDELLRKLGSKTGAGPSANSLKAPWTRAAMAELLPLAELTTDVQEVLRRWFGMALPDAKNVNDVLKAAGVRISPRGRN